MLTFFLTKNFPSPRFEALCGSSTYRQSEGSPGAAQCENRNSINFSHFFRSFVPYESGLFSAPQYGRAKMNLSDNKPIFLTTAGLANRWKMSQRTLEGWRDKGIGLTYRRALCEFGHFVPLVTSAVSGAHPEACRKPEGALWFENQAVMRLALCRPIGNLIEKFRNALPRREAR